MFHKALLALYIEFCEQAQYSKDTEIFECLLKLTKCIVKGNKHFYESNENKEQIYTFIVTHFNKLYQNVFFAFYKIIKK